MAAPLPLPPLEVLEALLTYDPLTGALRWRHKRGNRRAGSEAGCTDWRGYRLVSVQSRRYKAHRIAYAMHHGRDPYPLEIDHINRIRSDNRACNLRAVTSHQNRANSACADVSVEVTLPDGSTVLVSSQKAATELTGCDYRTVQRRVASGKPLHHQPSQVASPIPVEVTFPDGRIAQVASQNAAARLIGCAFSTVRRRLADGQPLQSGHRVRLA